MKKFFFCVGAFILFFFIYWNRLETGDATSLADMTIIVVVAFLALLSFSGAMNSSPRAWKELVFCRRRRHLRRKISEREKTKKMGTTTVALN